jgi:UDP-N-acetyl-D-mannosaminuronic acid transferase (WecB/TagA/CpsF family)
MGAPRQEAFLVALADSGWKGVGFTCGGYFDHLGEGFHYYPRLIDKFNLRWFYRIAREPRRLGYRNLIE